ncbi:MAG: hypothetical protein ABSC76_16295 [Terracidiphilus sp.]|jgi:hypothetical protein
MSATIGSAILFETDRIQSVELGRAMKQVFAPLVGNGHSGSRKAYAAVVNGPNSLTAAPNVLMAHKTFAIAYRKATSALSKLDLHSLEGPQKQFRVHKTEDTDVVFYLGSTSEAALTKHINKPSTGVYIMTSRLDSVILSGLELPDFPSKALGHHMIVQVKNLPGTAAGLLTEPDVRDEDCTSTEDADDVTVQWRHQFMETVECWTSATVADQSTSTATNKSAIASRWLREGKIFSISYKGQRKFPSFQFQNGSPAPAIAKVIEMFPVHARDWNLAFFFSTPNPYIGGHKPHELIRSNPDRLISLAQRFAHPADVF